MDHLLSKDMPVEVIQQGMVGQDLYLDTFTPTNPCLLRQGASDCC
jgi:hypothetical protein